MNKQIEYLKEKRERKHPGRDLVFFIILSVLSWYGLVWMVI